jgi:hypothetical protein
MSDALRHLGIAEHAAAGQGRHDEALALAEEAGAIAEASGAQGILRQLEELRTQLAAGSPLPPP